MALQRPTLAAHPCDPMDSAAPSRALKEATQPEKSESLLDETSTLGFERRNLQIEFASCVGVFRAHPHRL